MSAAEAAVGLLLVAAVGTLTRLAIRRQQPPPSELADTPPALSPLLGVVPPPRTESGLDSKISQP